MGQIITYYYLWSIFLQYATSLPTWAKKSGTITVPLQSFSSDSNNRLLAATYAASQEAVSMEVTFDPTTVMPVGYMKAVSRSCTTVGSFLKLECSSRNSISNRQIDNDLCHDKSPYTV